MSEQESNGPDEVYVPALVARLDAAGLCVVPREATRSAKAFSKWREAEARKQCFGFEWCDFRKRACKDCRDRAMLAAAQGGETD